MSEKASIQELSEQILPCDTSKPYAFVSYSKRDADKVYPCIIALQQSGCNIWVDKNMEARADQSWTRLAFDAIQNKNCVSIIFMISANSVISMPCFSEVTYSQKGQITLNRHRNTPIKLITVNADSQWNPRRQQFSQWLYDISDRYNDDMLNSLNSADRTLLEDLGRMLKPPRSFNIPTNGDIPISFMNEIYGSEKEADRTTVLPVESTGAIMKNISETWEKPAPAPVQEEAPAPKPVQEETPAPKPVQEETPAPAPVQEEPSAPATVREETPAPKSVQEEAPAPKPVQEETPAPKPVQEETPAPKPVQEEPPAPKTVQKETPAPKPVQEEPPAPKPVQEEPPAPKPVWEAPAPARSLEQESAKASNKKGPIIAIGAAAAAVLLLFIIIFVPKSGSGKNAPVSSSAGDSGQYTDQGASSSTVEGNQAVDPGDVIRFIMAWRDPDPSPCTQGCLKIAEEVKAATNGRIEFELFPGGELGSESEIFRLVLNSDIDIAAARNSLMTIYIPEMDILDQAYLWKNANEAHAAVDGPVGALIKEKAEALGIHVIGYMDSGFRNTCSKDPIESINDFAGVTIRTMENQYYQAAFESFGAMPIAMSYNDVYVSLQQGTIGACENTTANCLTSELYEVAPHITNTRHAFEYILLCMSDDAWNRIPEDLREPFMEAVQRGVDYERDLLVETNNDAVATLESAGVTFHDIDVAALQAAYQAKAKEKGFTFDPAWQAAVDEAIASVS